MFLFSFHNYFPELSSAQTRQSELSGCGQGTVELKLREENNDAMTKTLLVLRSDSIQRTSEDNTHDVTSFTTLDDRETLLPPDVIIKV
jgi:hypothetical protein